MKNNFFLVLMLSLAASVSFAQTPSFFQAVSETDVRLEKGMMRSIIPSRYQTYRLDYAAIKAVLQTAPWEFTAEARQHNCVISIPMGDGSMEAFAVWQTAMMEPELAAHFPYIRTYAGQSLKQGGLGVRISCTARGFEAMIMRPDFSTSSVQPYSWNQDEYYMAFNDADCPQNVNLKLDGDWKPGGDGPVLDNSGEYLFTPGEPGVADRGLLLGPVQMKVYRFVVATTGEFSQDHGGTAASVMSAVVSYTNQISGVFERDIDLRLQLIAGTENVIFLNAATDPFTGLTVDDCINAATLVFSNYTSINSFDVGHVFTRYSGGNQGVAGGITCTGGKGRGASAAQGVGDYGPHFRGIVGQEVGHQMSGGHTWNTCPPNDGRAGNTAFEPGSGSTIMSYAGLCGSQNIANDFDLYYHSGSIEEIRNFYTFYAGNECGSFLQTDNNAPVVTLPYQDNFFIPISTAFELNGSASDMDGDALFYNWEEIDAGPEATLEMPVANTATFRTLPAVPVSNRYFPKLSTILTNTSSNAEKLPTYSRDLTFRLTARDNHPNGGGVGWADVAFKSTVNAGPFLVLAPNSSASIWQVGEYTNVTWDVSNTNVSPVNCQKVNIRLSLDGGFTYPIMLAQDVTNDGGQYVLVPDTLTTKARIRVDAADNVFFDVSNANFKIQQPTQPSFTFGLSSDVQKICLPDNFTADILSAGVLGFNSPVSLDISGNLPPGATATFSSATINSGDPSTLTLDLQNVNVEGTFTFNVRAIVGSTADTLLRPITLTLVRSDFSALSLYAPADGSTGLGLGQTIKWNPAVDAENYDVQVSLSPAFDVILASKVSTVLDTFKIPVLLEKGTAYYWRVRPRNECGTADWTEPNFFSTYFQNCLSFQANDLPKVISGGTPTVESVITVNSGGIINDLNVSRIDGHHEYFGDLTARLISPAGTEVILFTNQCGNTSASFDFALDDASPSAFLCPPPNNGAAVRPQNPLLPFIGESSTGSWKLRIKDNVSGSGGSLDNFKLEFCATVALEPPYLVNNNTLQLLPGENQAVIPDLLLVEDANNTHGQLVFTLVTVPKYGRLEKNFGGEMQPGDQFTQADLDNGAIRFFDYGYVAGPDGFRFTVTDGEGGFLATPKFNISTGVTGTNEHTSDRPEFELFPNPAQDGVWIALNRFSDRDAQVTLLDISGRLVQKAVLPAGSDRLYLPVAGFPKGMYVVKVESEKGVGLKKLVLR